MSVTFSKEASAVATVLTACGIETDFVKSDAVIKFKLQQYLPLAVLKQTCLHIFYKMLFLVATVLTACGIET